MILPSTGAVSMVFFTKGFSISVAVCVSIAEVFVFSALSLKLIIVIIKAMTIVNRIPAIATVRLPILPSGSIIAGNSKMPMPPIENLRKLQKP